MEIISIGHLNYIPCSMITGIYSVDSRPMRSMISRAKMEKKLITATKKKKTKSMIVLNNGMIVLSAISSTTLANRFAGKAPTIKFEEEIETDEDEIEEKE